VVAIADWFLGLHFGLPCVESHEVVDMRTITLGVPPQEVAWAKLNLKWTIPIWNQPTHTFVQRIHINRLKLANEKKVPKNGLQHEDIFYSPVNDSRFKSIHTHLTKLVDNSLMVYGDPFVQATFERDLHWEEWKKNILEFTFMKKIFLPRSPFTLVLKGQLLVDFFHSNVDTLKLNIHYLAHSHTSLNNCEIHLKMHPVTIHARVLSTNKV